MMDKSIFLKIRPIKSLIYVTSLLLVGPLNQIDLKNVLEVLRVLELTVKVAWYFAQLHFL